METTVTIYTTNGGRITGTPIAVDPRDVGIGAGEFRLVVPTTVGTTREVVIPGDRVTRVEGVSA